MKPRNSTPFRSHASFAIAFSAALLSHFAAPTASAVTSTWTGISGNWSDTTTPGGVWTGGIPADGAGFTANFTGVDIATTDRVITLDTPRTIGNITFTDATTASNNLTIDGAGANILTLDVTTGSPLMNVTNQTLTISSEIQGSKGLTKSGAGDLVLSGTNTSFSGPVSITAGVLTLNNIAALGTASGITMANGSDLRLNGAPAGTFDYDYPISLTSGTATIKSFQGLANTFNLGGAISGLGGLTFANETNTGSATLSFVIEQPNTYRGNTTITAAAGVNTTLKLGANNALPTTTTLTINQASGNNGTNRNSILDLAGFNQTIAGLISTDIFQFENSLVRNTGGAATLTINNNITSRTFTGKIQQTGTLNLVKTGGNTQVLAGNNSYTGTTTVNGGPLTLDFSQFGSTRTDTPANYINSASVLELGGGTFTVKGRANGSAVASTAWTTPGTARPDITFTTLPAGIVVGQAITAGTGITGAGTTAYIVGISGNTISLNAHPTATSGTFETAATTVTTGQTFASTTLNPGRSGLTIDANIGNGTRMALNAITRNVGGTVNFTQPAGTISATNGFTTSTPNTAGTILGGWATVDGTDWATNNGTNVVALGSYNLTSVAGTTSASYAGADIDADSSAGLLDGVITPNSIRFNAAAANIVTLAAGNNTITSGGILVTSNVGANTSRINSGTLRGASGSDLVVNQYNTLGSLTIASVIDDNTTATALTKSGAGTLVLTGANLYTGNTYLNEGSLIVSAANNLGAPSSNLVFNGGTLHISGTALNNLSSLGRTVSVTPGKTVGLTIGDPTNTFTVDQLLNQSTGGFTKGGTGTVILDQANTYTGPTTISAGKLVLSGAGTLGSGANLTLSGGQLDLGGSSQTVSAVSISAAYASGDTILNGSLTGTSYAASNATGDAIISANLLANGAAGFTKTGAGTTTLSGTNTYTGTTAVNAGVLKIGSAGALGGGNLTLGGGVLGLGAGNFTVATIGTAAGNLQWTANGGFAAYGADRTVTIGTAGTSINWTATNFIGTGNELLLSAADSDATITFNKYISFSGGTRTINVANGSAAIDAKMPQIIAGGTSGTANAMSKSGTGTLALTNNGNTYWGATNITAGTLMLGDGTVNTGRISTNSATIAVSANATLAVNRTGATTQATDLNAVIISGAGGFSQVGSGTTTLTLANTYSGATTITAGTLALGATDVLPNTPTSTVFIGPGTLSIGSGFTDTVGTLKVAGAATITLGDASSKLAFADSSDPLITWAGSLNITGPIVYGGPSGSIRFGTSAAALRPDQLALITVNGGGSFALDSAGYLIEAAPGGFSTWIAGSGFANGSVPVDKRGPNDDFDNDGITNLVEYAIKDQDPTVSNASLGTFNGTTLSFDKRLDATGLTYAIQESTDLGILDTWAEVPAGPSYVNNATTIAYTLTPGSPAKNFLRLQVLSN